MSVTVNGKCPLRSQYTEMWGIQPATLSATYFNTAAPGKSVTYNGGVESDLILRSFTVMPGRHCGEDDNDEWGYIVQASSAVADFYTIPMSVNLFDPVDGVLPSEMKAAINDALPDGWELKDARDVAADAGAPVDPDDANKEDKANKLWHIRFNGTIAAALDAYAMMTGTLLTANHRDKTIVPSVPPSKPDPDPGDDEEDTLIFEAGYTDNYVKDVACYGHLNCLPAKNSLNGFPNVIDVQVPAGQWNVSPNPYVSRKIEKLDEKREEVSTAGLMKRTKIIKLTETFKATIFYIFRAWSAGVRQNEIIMIPKAEPDEDTIPSGNPTGPRITVSLSDTATLEDFLGSIKVIKDPYTDIEEAIEKVQEWEKELALKLSKDEFKGPTTVIDPTTGETITNPGDIGTYILFVQPNKSGEYSPEYLFGVHTYVVAAQKSRELTWERVTLISYVNDELKDATVVQGDKLRDFNADAHQIAFVAAENVLKHFVFHMNLKDCQRILFPYETSDAHGDGVLRVRNDWAPNKAKAQSYANALKSLYNLSHYIAEQGGTSNTCKYVEAYDGSDLRKLAYTRMK